MIRRADKNRPLRRALRGLRHVVEASLQCLLMGFFWLLPVDWASNLGGWLTRQIGSRLPVSRRALKHLPISFPDMSEAERRPIVARMSDNLDRLIPEYPPPSSNAPPKPSPHRRTSSRANR